MEQRVPILALLLVATLSGCQLGPRRLEISSSHDSDAVRVAASEQLLVNLVRLRYRDLPVFLGVSNISTQFEFDASVAADGGAALPGADSIGLGAGIRYSERPTISFSIRGGEDFQRRMLRPLAIEAIAYLAESGWRADRVLRLIVEEMNGLANAPTASGSSEGEPRAAAVAVRHRDRWFRIDDDDSDSKSTFLLLEQLFTLIAGEADATSPVLTLPVGG